MSDYISPDIFAKCPRCHYKNANNDKVCPSCGRKLVKKDNDFMSTFKIKISLDDRRGYVVLDTIGPSITVTNSEITTAIDEDDLPFQISAPKEDTCSAYC